MTTTEPTEGIVPSTTPPSTTPPSRAVPADRLPLGILLPLAAAGFVAVLTEALPAAVLPEMARGLSVSESAAGQTLTVYAVATALAAVPLTRLTAAWNRKRLLLCAVVLIAVASTVTAMSSSYALTMTARVAAGVAMAAIWGELVGYARRSAPPHLHGRAIALTMAGVPLALSLGIPLGTLLGELFGWRLTFALVAVVSVLLVAWIRAAVPDHPGRAAGRQEPVLPAVRLPGVAVVLLVVAAYVLGHNILYTYIATFLHHNGLGEAREGVLLAFGLACVVSILATGALVDRRLRGLVFVGAALFLLGAGLLTVFADNALLVHVAAVLWGLGWGGAPTLLQTAVTAAAGDRGQALLVAAWNGFTAAGAATGGLLLDHAGAESFPWAVVVLVVPVLAVVTLSRRHGFPKAVPSEEAPMGGRADAGARGGARSSSCAVQQVTKLQQVTNSSR